MAKHSSSRFMKASRTAFFRHGAETSAPCWICGQAIDYDATPNTTDDSHSLDHYRPVSLFPDLEEDPSNYRHSHTSCNRKRGNKMPTGEIGKQSRIWY